MQTRLVWPDATRGICVLAVVLFHVITWYHAPIYGPETGLSGLMTLFNQGLAKVRMPVLFALSGMFLASKLLQGWKAKGAAARVADTYYLYVLWIIVYFLVSWTLPSSVENRVTSFAELGIQLVLPGTSLWFIFALAVYAFAVALAATMRFRKGAVLSIALLLWGLSQLGDPDSLSLRVVTNFIFFALGAYFSDYLKALPKASTATCLAFVCTFIALLALRAIPGSGDMWVLALLPSLAAIPAVIVSVAGIANITWIGIAASFIGRRTLGIYVLHAPLIMLAAAYLHPGKAVSWAQNPVMDGMLAVGMTAAVTAGSLLLHSVLRRLPGNPLFQRPRSRIEPSTSRSY
ncbi:acyltransferase [Arthrobacter sp. Alg241-R88]|uniref:acyltransferase family protein n=1 Tax=Arthrobacter sp. Alg241-R88 TaxID=2305984 RepID=UPI0023DE15DC|nr:acyltransferase [Arthrobacter sp. Alg241-R88]